MTGKEKNQFIMIKDFLSLPEVKSSTKMCFQSKKTKMDIKVRWFDVKMVNKKWINTFLTWPKIKNSLTLLLGQL